MVVPVAVALLPRVVTRHSERSSKEPNLHHNKHLRSLLFRTVYCTQGTDDVVSWNTETILRFQH